MIDGLLLTLNLFFKSLNTQPSFFILRRDNALQLLNSLMSGIFKVLKVPEIGAGFAYGGCGPGDGDV